MRESVLMHSEGGLLWDQRPRGSVDKGQERNPLRAWHSTVALGWQFSILCRLSLPGTTAFWLA